MGVIRGLATGLINEHNLRETLIRELKMGLALSCLLGVAGAVRAALFMTPFTETLAITTSLVTIVFISVLLGAVLPLAMRYCQIDPAHSSTSIQVIMDILGVTIVSERQSLFAVTCLINLVFFHLTSLPFPLPFSPVRLFVSHSIRCHMFDQFGLLPSHFFPFSSPILA